MSNNQRADMLAKVILDLVDWIHFNWGPDLVDGKGNMTPEFHARLRNALHAVKDEEFPHE